MASKHIHTHTHTHTHTSFLHAQWDTYLAEDTRMCEFLIYACGSFLVQWSRELMTMDFQEMIMFLQVCFCVSIV